jgi:hypothetical protein
MDNECTVICKTCDTEIGSGIYTEDQDHKVIGICFAVALNHNNSFKEEHEIEYHKESLDSSQIWQEVANYDKEQDLAISIAMSTKRRNNKLIEEILKRL